MSDSVNLSKAQAKFMLKVVEQQLQEKEVESTKLLSEIEADKVLIKQLLNIISERSKSSFQNPTIIDSLDKTPSKYDPSWALMDKVDFILEREKNFMTVGDIATAICAIDDKYENINDLKLLLAGTLGPYAKANKRYRRYKEEGDSSFKYGLIDWIF